MIEQLVVKKRRRLWESGGRPGKFWLLLINTPFIEELYKGIPALTK
jgi:hypothetical protein